MRVIAGRLQAGIQAVEHRQQLAQQLLVGELAGLLDVTGNALALVLGSARSRSASALICSTSARRRSTSSLTRGGRIGGSLLGFDIWMFVVHVWVPGGRLRLHPSVGGMLRFKRRMFQECARLAKTPRRVHRQ